MDIKQILEKHEAWLRNEEGGERTILSGADLSGADLSRADLSGANLSGAKQAILQFIASQHQVVSIDDDVKIGCKRNSLAWWLENYEQVGESEKYTPDQIEEYGLILRHIEAVLKIRKK